MKKLMTTLGLALLLAMFPTACVGPAATPDQKAQLIADTAVFLRSAARNGAMFAIDDDPNNAKWFVLAQTAISTFLTGKDYSPAAFQAAINTIPAQALKNKWVKYAVFNVVDLYQLYYGRYVQGVVEGNVYAKAFLEAVQDGFKQAVEASKPPA